MKVLQINAVYGHGSTGVITRDIEQLCETSGIECYVASPDSKVCEANRGYKIGNIIDHKIHALLCRIAGKQAYFSVWATKRLLAYMNKIKPDIVHLHNLHSNYIHLNMLLQYLAKEDIRTVITLHDCWFYTGGCFHYTTVNCKKWKYKCGQCIKQRQDTPAYIYDASAKIQNDRLKYLSNISNLIFVGASEWVATELSKSRLKECGKICYIHNGFDLGVFSSKTSDLKKRLDLSEKFVVLGPASKWLQSVNKETLEYFTKHLPMDCVLLLFGSDGKEVNLPNNVKLYGYTRNREELAELYSMADVMVNCSREDTLSSLNLEAQACGTPVVTYDSTGSKETVDGMCGYSIETGDYEKLYNFTMKVKEKGKEYYSKYCREFISRNFEKEANYHKYISLYKQLVDE
ncbi:MAG: glycosyltransferase [Bacteroidales bacterium]|nr:glycosyltransferase [Bacteroidales bacterium]